MKTPIETIKKPLEPSEVEQINKLLETPFKEFWINKSLPGMFHVSTEAPSFTKADYHVIEFEAYDKLKKEFDTLLVYYNDIYEQAQGDKISELVGKVAYLELEVFELKKQLDANKIKQENEHLITISTQTQSDEARKLMVEVHCLEQEVLQLNKALEATEIKYSELKAELNEVNRHNKELYNKKYVETLHYKNATIELEAYTAKQKLAWLVNHAIESAAISKAKGAELLDIPLIDMDAFLQNFKEEEKP